MEAELENQKKKVTEQASQQCRVSFTPSVIIAGHVVVGQDGSTSGGNDGWRHDALVDPEEEEQKEDEAGDGEERMVTQGLSE